MNLRLYKPNPQCTFGQLGPRFVLEKYCCTTEKAISVSTNHLYFNDLPSALPHPAIPLHMLAIEKHRKTQIQRTLPGNGAHF